VSDHDTPERRILIIDDDVDILSSVIQILRTEGYAAAGAENGLDAMRLLHAGPKPCLILLDLMMPVMNGWQFCAKKEQDPAIAEIPVVVISGDGGIDRKAASVGAAGYLKKPIELDVLLETVAHYCTQ
jgi:CheY-like chemotaxis protein